MSVPDPPRLIAIIVYPGCAFLDVAVALQALLGCAPDYRVTTVAARIRPLAGDGSIRLLAERTFDESPAPAVLIVPGGGAPALASLADRQLVSYVQASAARAELTAAIGTGSLVLAAAGVLRGRQAAAPAAYADVLAAHGAAYRPYDVVVDGPFITAAGSASAQVLARTLLAHLALPGASTGEVR